MIFIYAFSFLCISYLCILRPFMKNWGVSKDQIHRKLEGDKFFSFTSSTRAISINASRENVWSVLVQIGADRKGFFSYKILENIMGYKSLNKYSQDSSMPLGRIIPSTVSKERVHFNYSWKVIAVTPGNSFVLSNWGSFLLTEVNSNRTELMVRTYGQNTDGLSSRFIDFIIFPFHYIMKRRMLIGIKMEVESETT